MSVCVVVVFVSLSRHICGHNIHANLSRSFLLEENDDEAAKSRSLNKSSKKLSQSYFSAKT